MTSQELMRQIVLSLDRHKAVDIQVLHVENVTALTDYFVIAEGGSNTQVKALTDYVEEELSRQGVEPLRKEGYGGASWVLTDYGSVIVHVFLHETRQYYDLERLWTDGVSVDIAEFLENEER